MGAEMPIFTVFVARMVSPELHLAAWGSLVFPVSMVVEGPVIMLLAASTALAVDSENYRRLRRYMLWMAGVLSLAHIAIAFTPLFDFVANTVLGVPAEVLEPGRIGLQIMTPWTAAIAWRRLNQGVLIRYGHSKEVAIGTLIRLVFLIGALAWGLLFSGYSGIVVGAIAVALGVTAEALAIHRAVTPIINNDVAAAPQAKIPIRIGPFLKFYLPLAVTPLMTLFIQPAGAAGMSRMPETMASLAAWPAVHGLIFLLRGSGFAFNEVVVALAGLPDGRIMLRQFARRLAGITVGILALIGFSPLGTLWFGTVSGLSPELTSLSATAIMLAVLMPGYQVYQSLYQGLLVHHHQTKGISEAVLLYVVIALAGLYAGSQWSPVPGIYWAIATFVCAGVSQTVWLRTRTARFLHTP